MSENWDMLIIGVVLVVFGIGMTAISGAMPGAKPLHPPTPRFRLILISFGVVMAVLGTVGIIRK